MNKKIKSAIITSLFLGTTFVANAADYKVDYEGAHASIQFKIKHLGYSRLTGRFNKFDGQFSYDSAKLADSKIVMNIDVSSLDSNHAERNKHLKGKGFLETDKYPKSTFVSSKVVPHDDGTFDVIGNLTLHGVTKEVVISASKVGEGNDPWGGYRAGFTGTTSIALKDFNIERDLGESSTHVDLILNIEGIKI